MKLGHIKTIVRSCLPPYYFPARWAALRELIGLGAQKPQRDSAHLRAAVEWLFRSQDAGDDDGSCKAYSLKTGWGASYPETSGYIVPTLYDYYQLVPDSDGAERALRMAKWLVSVQLDGGGIPAGSVFKSLKQPTVFNTGQVLLGFVRAYQESGEEAFLAATERAADWLVSVQDDDGEWRSFDSLVVRSKGVNRYNTRTSWPLLKAHQICPKPAYETAAIRNLEISTRKQHENGWFPDNCLWDDSQPLLHTISYTIRGLLESGIILNAKAFTASARHAADALLAQQNPDGSLFGCFDVDWQPRVKWICLTGCAQIAIIWFRLFEMTQESRYFDAAARATHFLKTVQQLDADNPGIRGCIKGSSPIYAAYGPYLYLNWATKFFADALMLKMQIETSNNEQETGETESPDNLLSVSPAVQ